MVICKGLKLCSEAGLVPTSIELDATLVIGLIKPNTRPFLEVGLLIEDILFQLESSSFHGISVVPRSITFAADHLAKLALSLDCNFIWLEDAPSCLWSLIRSDHTCTL